MAYRYGQPARDYYGEPAAYGGDYQNGLFVPRHSAGGAKMTLSPIRPTAAAAEQWRGASGFFANSAAGSAAAATGGPAPPSGRPRWLVGGAALRGEWRQSLLGDSGSGAGSAGAAGSAVGGSVGGGGGALGATATRVLPTELEDVDSDGEDDLATLPPPSLIEPHNRAAQRWSALEIAHLALVRLSPLVAHRYAFLTALQLQHNLLATLPVSVGELRHLRLLDLSYNRFRVVPACVVRLVTLERLLFYGNRLRDLPLLLGRLCRLAELGLDRDLRLATPPPAIVSGGTRSIVHWLRDNMPPGERPRTRKLIEIRSRRSADAKADESGGSDEKAVSSVAPTPKDATSIAPFTVFAYNVLAENYATSTRHSYCPSWALKWSYRREVVLKALLDSKADVLCLQEVEAGQFEAFFAPRLKDAGYDGRFVIKSRARNMDNSSHVDGCATFYRRQRFTFVEERRIEYQSIAIKKHKEFRDQRALQRLLGRDNVALVLALRVKPRSDAKADAPKDAPVVLVANTHIHWNPQMCDVKLMQVAFLLEEVEAMVEEHKKARRRDVPVVICGDFNLTPASGAFSLLSDGRVVPDHSDFAPSVSGDDEADREWQHAQLAALKDTRGLDEDDNGDGSKRGKSQSGASGEDETGTGEVGDLALNAKFVYGRYTREGIKHSLGLRSAYAPLDHPFTNYTDTFVGSLDYIWFSEKVMRVKRVLEPVNEDDVRFTCLPSPHAGSDHTPIAAEIQLLKDA